MLAAQGLNVCAAVLACSPLQEKEKLYVELKGILARQPGPEVAEQLSIYQVGLATAPLALRALPVAQLPATSCRPVVSAGVVLIA